ncbi:MAG: DoxX family protein [Bacteroidia bacterium]
MTKKDKIIYWIFTGLFAAFMFFTAFGDVIVNETTIKFMNGMLGYPIYLLPFLGVAKMLGAIAIVIPGFPRLKEWAYAGLAYDLIGAAYSVAMLHDIGGPIFIAVLFAVGTVSYVYHRKRIAK